jgi:hypothetical protein
MAEKLTLLFPLLAREDGKTFYANIDVEDLLDW